MRSRYLSILCLLMALICAATPGRAAQMTVSPTPTPLDGSLTVQGEGFPLYSPVFFYWDIEKNQQIPLDGDLYAIPQVLTDLSGNFTLTIQNLAGQVYLANAGTHTLTAYSYNAFSNANVEVQVQLSPRQGWTPPAPLPQQPVNNALASGMLSYLNYSADGTTTAMKLTDGKTTQTLAAFDIGRVMGSPDFSPDGTKIAFSAGIGTNPDANLYLLDTHGDFTQVTADGGTLPQSVGGGTGSIVGTVLPLQATSASGGDENSCQGSAQELFYPPSITVELVGTSNVTTAAPLDNMPGYVDYAFTLPNVPAGHYWLHALDSVTICQQIHLNQQLIDQLGTAEPSFAVPVEVTAGQVTTVPEIQLADDYLIDGLPTWLDNTTLFYTQLTGTFQDGDGPTSTTTLSVQPVGQTAQPPTVATVGSNSLFVSPVNQKVVGFSPTFLATYVADASNPSKTFSTLDSDAAYLLQTSGKEDIGDSDFSWSPDGGYIAFIRNNPLAPPPSPAAADASLATVGDGVGDLWIKDVATGDEAAWTQFNLQGGEGATGRPAWSPDLKQISVTYTDDGLKTTNIRIINVADASFFDLTTDGLSAFPAWTGQTGLADFPNNLGTLPQTPTAPTAVPGDLNGDGKVTISDAILALDIAVGLAQATPAQLQAGDIEGTGPITVADVVKILELAVGLG